MQRLRKESSKLEELLGSLKEEILHRTASNQHTYGQGNDPYEDWEDEKVALEI